MAMERKRVSRVDTREGIRGELQLTIGQHESTLARRTSPQAASPIDEFVEEGHQFDRMRGRAVATVGHYVETRHCSAVSPQQRGQRLVQLTSINGIGHVALMIRRIQILAVPARRESDLCSQTLWTRSGRQAEERIASVKDVQLMTPDHSSAEDSRLRVVAAIGVVKADVIDSKSFSGVWVGRVHGRVVASNHLQALWKGRQLPVGAHLGSTPVEIVCVDVAERNGAEGGLRGEFSISAAVQV